MKTIGELAPTLFADRQARRGLMPPWANGKNGKEYRADHGPEADRRHLQRRRRGAVPLEGLGAERGRDPPLGGGRHRQRPAAVVHQVRRHACTTSAGSSRSRRSTPGATAPSTTCATSGRSPASAWSTRSRPPGSMTATASGSGSRTTTLGLYQALIEARIPFEMVHDRLLDPGHLAPFKTLILPNIAALSDAQVPQLARLRRRGGGLVATHETSLYDEWGVRRARLRPGGSLRRHVRGAPAGADAELVSAPRARAGPGGIRSCAGLEDAPRIINGAWRSR